MEDLTVGSSVSGLVNNEAVEIIAVKWYGNSVLNVTFKNNRGQLADQLVYRADEERFEILDDNLPWSFDADGDIVRLASEAYRINLAHLFDPYLAVHTSSIEPLPHQISAVYREMLPRLPLRYILADDPGAGKTIMTGLLPNSKNCFGVSVPPILDPIPPANIAAKIMSLYSFSNIIR